MSKNFFICNSLPQRRSLGYQVTPGKQARVVSFNYYAKPADPGIEWKNRNFIRNVLTLASSAIHFEFIAGDVYSIEIRGEKTVDESGVI